MASDPMRELLQPVVQDEEFEVECICGHKREGCQWKVEVKWVGYEEASNTWEPLNNLQNAPQEVEEYIT